MSARILIGELWVGEDEPALVIAEVGSNHNRRWEWATQLIDVAAEAGADAVKFQLFTAGDLYPPGASEYAVVQQSELPMEWIPRLAEHASKQGLMFLGTPFSREAIDALSAVGVPAYKWASSETTNLSLLRYAAVQDRPLLVSTGMCDIADVDEAVSTVRGAGNDDIILLQCTSLYPTQPQNVHLRAMDTLRAAFQLPVGLSDHTENLIVPALAVARGACVVEKHLTLDRTAVGPDHPYALEPADFRVMVSAVRVAEQVLGSAIKKMLPQEAVAARRTSIRAARDIAAGEVLARDDLRLSSPADGLRPRYLDGVVDRCAEVAIPKDGAITWKKISAS